MKKKKERENALTVHSAKDGNKKEQKWQEPNRSRSD